jgi:hypothetical protein
MQALVSTKLDEVTGAVENLFSSLVPRFSSELANRGLVVKT